MIPNLDLFDDLGAANAMSVVIPVTVSDCVLDIDFAADADNATLSADDLAIDVDSTATIETLSAGLGGAAGVAISGGVSVNNVRIESEEWVPQPADFLHRRWLVLRRGKRNIAGVERVA